VAECEWLLARGNDASDGLLAEADARIMISTSAGGAARTGVASRQILTTMWCETVIMHLDRAKIAPSGAGMLDIVKSGGNFYLKWRVTKRRSRQT